MKVHREKTFIRIFLRVDLDGCVFSRLFPAEVIVSSLKECLRARMNVGTPSDLSPPVRLTSRWNRARYVIFLLCDPPRKFPLVVAIKETRGTPRDRSDVARSQSPECGRRSGRLTKPSELIKYLRGLASRTDPNVTGMFGTCNLNRVCADVLAITRAVLDLHFPPFVLRRSFRKKEQSRVTSGLGKSEPFLLV